MKFKSMLALALFALTIGGLNADVSTDEVILRGKHKNHDKKRSSHDKHRHSSKDSCDRSSKDSCDRERSSRDGKDCPGQRDPLRVGIFNTDNQFDGLPLTILDPTTQTASGFDPFIWCELGRCVRRDVEFIAFTQAPNYTGNLRLAFQALLDGHIDVIGTSVSRDFWLSQNLNRQTNLLIGIDCGSIIPMQNIVWNETYIPKGMDLTGSSEKVMTKLWQIDGLVFGTGSEKSPAFNELKIFALAAGRSEEYFASHVIKDIDNYGQTTLNYLANFGAIGSADKYQALYLKNYSQESLGATLQRLHVSPWANASQNVDVSRSQIKFMTLDQNLNFTLGYLLRRDCCQLIRDLQECLNAIICNGTYNLIWQSLAEQFPISSTIAALCTPALYASFAERTVSNHCICCTMPHKPCVRVHPCAIPCTAPYTVFAVV